MPLPLFTYAQIDHLLDNRRLLQTGAEFRVLDIRLEAVDDLASRLVRLLGRLGSFDFRVKPTKRLMGLPKLRRVANRLGQAQEAVANYHAAAQLHLKALIQEAQTRLRGAGFDAGPVDGVLGPQTTNAIRKYQQSQGLPLTGELDEVTLKGLFIDPTPATSP